MSRRRHVILAGLILASGVGCSLVYPYGSVEESSQEGPDASGDAATSDVAMTPDHAAGGDDGSIPGDGTAPGQDAGVDAAPAAPVGAVVVSGVGYGTDGGQSYVLSVLDPTTGKELSREDTPVVGVVYDGVQDVWYVFETLNPGAVYPLGPYPPAPGDAIVLHVRKLDTHTGAWTELTSLPVPTLTSPDLITTLANRLVFVAYAPADAGGGDELVVLDTTSPANTSASASDPAVAIKPIGFSPSAIIGTRTSLTGGQGGEVTLVQNSSSSGPGNFQFMTAKVGASSTTIGPLAVVIGAYTASQAELAASSFLSGPSGAAANVFALPETADASAELVQYDPTSGASLGTPPIAFGATSLRLRLAISECAQTAFISQLTPQTILFAVPLGAGGGTPAAFNITHSVSTVRFEPYTNTAIATFNSGAGWELTALTLGGTSTAPTLTSRTATSATNPWAPPGDLRPTTIAVRAPLGFCP